MKFQKKHLANTINDRVVQRNLWIWYTISFKELWIVACEIGKDKNKQGFSHHDFYSTAAWRYFWEEKDCISPPVWTEFAIQRSGLGKYSHKFVGEVKSQKEEPAPSYSAWPCQEPYLSVLAVEISCGDESTLNNH